jgi:hypothetical protein
MSETLRMCPFCADKEIITFEGGRWANLHVRELFRGNDGA